MKRLFLLLALAGWCGAAVFAGALGDPTPPVTKHIEIAGTLVIEDGALVLKSNGHQYILALDPSEPGVSTLKSGTALIVKGTLTITEGPGDEKTRSLRPDEMIIRGRTYEYGEPLAP